MDKRQARAWVRRHWQEFMSGADYPDLMTGAHLRGEQPLTQPEIEAIFQVFADESARLSDRLEPRNSGRKAGRYAQRGV